MTKKISITAFLTVLTVILFSSQMFIPLFGIVLSFFSTIPIMIINFLTEKRYTIMSVISSSLIIVMLNDPFGWILFMLILVPSTLSNFAKNKIISLSFIFPVLLGTYILYSVMILNGSSFELFLKNVWYIIGIIIFFTLKHFLKKIEIFIKYKYLNKLRKEL